MAFTPLRRILLTRYLVNSEHRAFFNATQSKAQSKFLQLIAFMMEQKGKAVTLDMVDSTKLKNLDGKTWITHATSFLRMENDQELKIEEKLLILFLFKSTKLMKIGKMKGNSFLKITA